MTMRNFSDKLPDELREELAHKILTERPRVQDVTDWLAAKGYKVSRSAVHRAMQDVVEADQLMKLSALIDKREAPGIRFLKLRCLELADRNARGGEDELELAERYFAWIVRNEEV